MPIPRRPWLTKPARRLGVALVWTAAGFGAGYGLRALAIEPEAIGRVCLAPDAPFWCLPRQAMIGLFHLNVIGGVGLAAGLLALAGNRLEALRGLARRVRARPLALLAGGLGLALYNAGLGAAAVTLGLLAAMDED